MEVVSPNVFPVLPVSVDVSNMEFESSGVWSPFTGGKSLDAVRGTIMEDAAKRAMTGSMLSLQREEARKTVREFIQKWVVDSRAWEKGKPYVRVLFLDEAVK